MSDGNMKKISQEKSREKSLPIKKKIKMFNNLVRSVNAQNATQHLKTDKQTKTLALF